MSKRVLLTGATGFLGNHLCQALVERGYEVHAYRRASSNLGRLGGAAQKTRWHKLPADLEAPFRGEEVPEAVIHCAALYGRQGESAPELLEANTALPVRLYHLAAEHLVPLFLNTGTILDPALNLYALSKHHAVEWLRRISGPTRVLNLKLQHIYGPQDDRTKFVTSMISQCAAHVPEIRLTDGRQRRDFVFVADVVSAFLTLLESDAEIACSGSAFSEFEVGSGEATEVRSLVERIHQMTHSRSRLLFGAVPHRAGEPMLAQADTRALSALGWRAQVGLDEGLRRTVAAQEGVP